MNNIAVFATGRGSNFEQLAQAEKDGRLKAHIALLIAGKPDIGAIEIAKQFGISYSVIDSKQFSNAHNCTQAFISTLEQNKIDIIALAGWLRLLDSALIKRYKNRIVNIHPALLPFFGGKGMYGIHVHRAVKKSGMLVSGATVHLVNEHYDEGKIIKQQAVALEQNDTAEEIAAKVLKVEHRLYSEAINYLVENPVL